MFDARKRYINTIEDENRKFHEFYDILLQWIKVHQTGHTLADFFIKNQYKTIAIYGMKELGQALLNELNNSGVEVKYGIDRDADSIFAPVEVYRPDEKLDDVDVIVITAVHYYNDIVFSITDKMNCPIISLDDVVYEADL